jgi:hypothetical protein
MIALAVLVAFVILRATDSQPVQLLRFKVLTAINRSRRALTASSPW